MGHSVTAILNDPAQVLSIGMVLGGRTPENRPWLGPIQQLMRDVTKAREGFESAINVNVELQVPGNLFGPDFEGVRTGAFRKADSLLKVQVAIPSTAPMDPRASLLGFLNESLDAVDVWLSAREARSRHVQASRNCCAARHLAVTSMRLSATNRLGN